MAAALLLLPWPGTSPTAAAAEATALGSLGGVHLSLDEPQWTEPDRAGLERELAAILRSRGLRLLSATELRETAGEPVLKVRVATCGPRQGVVAYTVLVDLYQNVHPAGAPDVSARAAIWSAQATGFAGAVQPEELRRPIATLTERFASDWLEASRQADAPAQRPGTSPRPATVLEPATVFSGPGSIFDLLGNLPRGSVVRILEEQNGWVRVGTDRIPSGWVHADFVSTTTGPGATLKTLP